MKTVFFNMLLENVKANELNLRDNIQQLVESAVDPFGQHVDTSRHQALVNAGKHIHCFRSQLLKHFIKESPHVPSKSRTETQTVRRKGY